MWRIRKTRAGTSSPISFFFPSRPSLDTTSPRILISGSRSRAWMTKWNRSEMERPPVCHSHSCVTSRGSRKAGPERWFPATKRDGADDFRDLSLSGCHAAIIMLRELNTLSRWMTWQRSNVRDKLSLLLTQHIIILSCHVKPCVYSYNLISVMAFDHKFSNIKKIMYSCTYTIYICIHGLIYRNNITYYMLYLNSVYLKNYVCCTNSIFK